LVCEVLPDNALEVIKVLIESGGKYDDAILTLAVHYKSVPIMEYLFELGFSLEQKNKKNKTPFVIAAGCNNQEVMSFLIQKGIDINHKDNSDALLDLRLDSRTDRLEVFNYLIEKGLDLNKSFYGLFYFDYFMCQYCVVNESQEDQFKELIMLMIKNGAKYSKNDYVQDWVRPYSALVIFCLYVERLRRKNKIIFPLELVKLLKDFLPKN